jgi:hypothetical protein
MKTFNNSRTNLDQPCLFITYKRIDLLAYKIKIANLIKRSFSSSLPMRYSNHSFNDEFIDNKLSVFLPPTHDEQNLYRINGQYPGTFVENFSIILSRLNLSKDFTYKLDFQLFLYTNDASKSVKYILSPPYMGENLDDNAEYMAKDMAILSFSNQYFKYKGYSTIHSVLIDFRSSSWEEETFHIAYAHQTIVTLRSLIANTHEDVENNGFIEFKKWVILDITRIKNKS